MAIRASTRLYASLHTPYSSDCMNGGTYNATTDSCDCPPAFQGSQCMTSAFKCTDTRLKSKLVRLTVVLVVTVCVYVAIVKVYGSMIVTVSMSSKSMACADQKVLYEVTTLPCSYHLSHCVSA